MDADAHVLGCCAIIVNALWTEKGGLEKEKKFILVSVERMILYAVGI
uniref:Uncharacterized protein n=1 Tax=Anguilla anguilla TaxID=7936 RepID=A0A0E9RJG2_ANGAN